MFSATAGGSWRVTPAVLVTPAWMCALLFVILGAAELAARNPDVRDALLAPSLGSPSRRFELQLDGLERYSSSNGGVECIVFGNSTALMGVDPEALASGYQARAGEPLRCFNFGVAGMTASAAGAVAPILINRHRPRLLVYVVSPRDLGTSVDGPLLANTPWVQYQRGTFSINGWLTEHSSAFRYYLLYRQWLDPSRWPAAKSPSGTTGAGFFPLEKGLSLSPALWRHTQRTYQRILDQPPSQAELVGFERLLDLSDSGTQLLVVEAPAHERLRQWAHSTTLYESSIAYIQEATRRQRVAFWRVPAAGIVPADGWADFVHLNARGAARFSEWLGARLGTSLQPVHVETTDAVAAQG